MNAIRSAIRRHPLPAYFVLTFAISWGAMLALIILGGGGLVPSEERAEELLPWAVAAVVAGPFPAALLCTAISDGLPGLRDLRTQFLRWRVNWSWYALAFFGAPVMGLGVLFLLLPASSQFAPGVVDSSNPVALAFSGAGVGLVAGIFEEAGWTGFATPRLRRRYGILAAGLLLGFLWGAWHYITALWGSGTASGSMSVPLFSAMMLFYVAVLPPYRVLMTWVYDRTRSLPVAIVMHASLTGNVLYTLMPPDIGNWPLFAWYAGMAAVLWTIIVVSAVAARGRAVSLRPLPSQAT